MGSNIQFHKKQGSVIKKIIGFSMELDTVTLNPFLFASSLDHNFLVQSSFFLEFLTDLVFVSLALCVYHILTLKKKSLN